MESKEKIVIQTEATAITDSQFWKEVEVIAQSLSEIDAGSVVAIQSAKSIRNTAAIFAIWHINCMPLILNYDTPDLYRSKWISKYANHAVVLDDVWIERAEQNVSCTTEIELNSWEFKTLQVANGTKGIVTISKEMLQNRYNFCKTTLNLPFQAVWIPKQNDFYLRLFVLMEKGTCIFGDVTESIAPTCMIAPLSVRNKLVSKILEEKIPFVLSYGNSFSKEIEEQLKEQNVRTYNIYDIPTFYFLSSSKEAIGKPVKTISAAVVNESGGLQPTGMFGKIVVKENDELEFKDTGLQGRLIKKNLLEFSEENHIFVEDMALSISELEEALQEIPELTVHSIAISSNKLYAFCSGACTLKNVYQYLQDRLPAAYQQVIILKLTDEMYRTDVYRYEDVCTLERELQNCHLNQICCDPTFNTPSSMDFYCSEGQISDLKSFLIEKRMVKNAVFCTASGQEVWTLPQDKVQEERMQIILKAFQACSKCAAYDVCDDFFQKGGNSIGFIQLISMLEKAFSCEMDMQPLLAHATPQCCYEFLFESKQQAVQSVTTEQLIADCKVSLPTPENQAGTDLDIFLTGATGFIGVFVLKKLLEKTDKTIYCLVRAQNTAQGLKRIYNRMEQCGLQNNFDAKRIVAVPGNIEQEFLGIEKEQYEFLTQRIGIVIHSAAKVDFFYTYEMLKQANVNAVVEILKFAAKGVKKEISYLSSVAIMEDSAYPGLADETTDISQYPPTQFGYNQTKWVGDMIFQRAKENGFSVQVIRTGTACGDTKNGYWQQDDFIRNILQLCVELGYYSDFIMGVHLMPVDRMADVITEIALGHTGKSNQNYHVYGADRVQILELLEWVKESGVDLKKCELPEWLEKVQAFLQERPEEANKPYAVVQAILENSMQIDDTQFISDVSSKKTYEQLSTLGINNDSVKKEEFLTYLKNKSN